MATVCVEEELLYISFLISTSTNLYRFYCSDTMPSQRAQLLRCGSTNRSHRSHIRPCHMEQFCFCGPINRIHRSRYHALSEETALPLRLHCSFRSLRYHSLPEGISLLLRLHKSSNIISPRLISKAIFHFAFHFCNYLVVLFFYETRADPNRENIPVSSSTGKRLESNMEMSTTLIRIPSDIKPLSWALLPRNVAMSESGSSLRS